MPTKRIFGFNRNIFFLGLVSFFNDFSAEMVQAVMPVFLTTVLGASAFFVGVLEGAADALASVLKVFSGWLSDKLRKRKAFAVLGYTLSVGVRPLLALVTLFSQVFALRLIDRVGKGLRDAPRDAMISESIDRYELGRSFGLHRALDTLGGAVGPLFAFFLLPALGNNYRSLFLVAFVIGLGAIASFAFVKDNIPPPRVDPRPPRRLNWELFRENKRFVLVVASIFIFGLGALPLILLLLKAKEVGFPSGDLPLVYFVYSLAFLLSAVPVGKLADKIGTKKVIAGGFFISAITYALLSATSSAAFTIVCFALLGLHAAATDGVERALAAKNLPHEILAAGQGFLNMAVGFSSLVAGALGGFLWTTFGSASAFLYAGILSACGLLLFLFVVRDRTLINVYG